LCEALTWLETDSAIEPPAPDTEVTDPTHEACPAGILYKANILEWWKVNGERFPNLVQIAKDILAGQGSRV